MIYVDFMAINFVFILICVDVKIFFLVCRWDRIGFALCFERLAIGKGVFIEEVCLKRERRVDGLHDSRKNGE